MGALATFGKIAAGMQIQIWNYFGEHIFAWMKWCFVEIFYTFSWTNIIVIWFEFQ